MARSYTVERDWSVSECGGHDCECCADHSGCSGPNDKCVVVLLARACPCTVTVVVTHSLIAKSLQSTHADETQTTMFGPEQESNVLIRVD